MVNWAKRALLIPLVALSAAGCSAKAPDQQGGEAAVQTSSSPVPSEAGVSLPPVDAASTSDADEGAEASSSPVHVAALPEDVKAFIARRDLCDHFRGEEPYDQERKAFLDQKLEETCTGTDAALKGIRRKYRDNSEVIAALWDYDDVVE
jgi:hypothetical protein